MPTNAHAQPKFPKINSRYVWIGLGIFALVLNTLFRMNPYFTEVVYSRGIYLLIRWIWDYTLGLIPIPLLYLLVPALIFWGIRRWRKRKAFRASRPFKNQLASHLVSLLAFAGIVIFFFYFLWGYNYSRLPVPQQLKFSPKQLTDQEVEQEFIRVTEILKKATPLALDSLSTQLRRDSLPAAISDSVVDVWFTQAAYRAAWDHQALEAEIRPLLVQQLQKHNYPTPGRPRIRNIHPKGFLMQLGAIGIYIPFVAEGSVDAALHESVRASTMAHELAHAYGFGDEGTCNFWAYLACNHSDNPVIRYAGNLSYWRRVASLYRSRDPKCYAEAIKELPANILRDLRKIQEISRQYPGFFPRFYRSFYDRYLKSQGIPEGQKSYSKVVSYVVAYEKKYGNLSR